jgi:hypothetical protein
MPDKYCTCGHYQRQHLEGLYYCIVIDCDCQKFVQSVILGPEMERSILES